MKTRTHLRNVTVALCSTLLALILATQQLPVAAAPQAQSLDFSWNVASGTISGQPGQSNIQFTATLNNRGASDSFGINTVVPAGWQAVVISPGQPIAINANAGQNFTFFVSIPTNAAAGNYTVDALAFRNGAPSTTALLRLTVTVTTPTATPTATTAPASPTPTRGPVCADGFEPDNGPAEARRIDVQIAQERTICPTGDEDWLYFGGVAGKVYTIDVSSMNPGIDLSLELFDSNLLSIAFNDDYFNRDPAVPNPGDTKPRITIRIPADGTYYVKVRDTAGRGGINYFYVIALRDESSGPTPTTVTSVCLDIFEPDGLPEQARLLTSNEIQETRRLCPTGDADWVMFFAKTGKRYVIYTDTRRYRGPNVVNGDAQAGADTVIVLTDRDGVSILDINDDMPGAATLDSQIEFIPEVDGFYFVQIKNVGDIGNQFIRYDLVLLLCLPGQTDCARPATPPAGQPVSPLTPQPTSTPADEFTLDPTRTPQALRPRPAEQAAWRPAPGALQRAGS